MFYVSRPLKDTLSNVIVIDTEVTFVSPSAKSQACKELDLSGESMTMFQVLSPHKFGEIVIEFTLMKHTALFILVGQLSATTTQLLSSQESAFSSQPSTELEAAPVHHKAILKSLSGVDMENGVVPETQEEHPQQETGGESIFEETPPPSGISTPIVPATPEFFTPISTQTRAEVTPLYMWPIVKRFGVETSLVCGTYSVRSSGEQWD